MAAIIFQIILIDIVFSLDSIITAVGMVDEVEIMIAAVVVSVGLMMLFASAIGNFVSDHPTIKTLALSFLMVVGVALIADGFDTHVPKGYIYFAMAFSVIVEMLNIRLRKKKSAARESVMTARLLAAVTLALLSIPLLATGAQRMQLEVDAREAPRRVLHARLTIPVAPGPLTLVYPKWLPGTHGPTGPVTDLVGIRISAGGQPVAWQRDSVDLYAFKAHGAGRRPEPRRGARPGVRTARWRASPRPRR